MRFLITSLVLTAFLPWAAPQAQAPTVVTINFEGLTDQEPVEDYYAGGLGGFGTGPGPDFGVVFSENVLAFIDSDEGGTGPVANEPSPDTVGSHAVGFLTGIEVPGGFTGLSFFYTTGNPDQTLSVDVFSLVDGSLVIEILPGTAAGSGDPTGGQLGVWNQADISFEGVAHGVVFTTPWVVDDITMTLVPGPPPPPLPAISGWGVAVLALAMPAAAWMVERRRRA